MKKQNFTFKTNKPTGRWKCFDSNINIIKYNKIKVGQIDDEPPFSIRLMVIKKDILEDNNPNCKWRWITLNKKSNSLIEAKEFLNNNIIQILEKFELHLDN